MNENADANPLAGLEERISRVERELEKLKGKPEAGTPKPPPPKAYGYTEPWQHGRTAAPPPPRPPATNSPGDSEEFIGRKVLPAVGAILLLAALACWTPVAYRSITPAAAFGLELAFCALFFVAGRILRHTKAQFGEVISGIGAGSLLITIAAGSQYHHLYSGETMVGFCLGASFAVGAYGLLMRSRTFEAIGAVGGMAGAWMPSMQHDLYLSAALQAIIVTATLSVFASSKWRVGIIALWPIAMLTASQFLLAGNLDWRWRVAELDLLGLQFALAYALAYDEWNFDPQMVFPVVTLGLSALASLALKSGYAGSAHVAIYCCVIAAAGFLFGPQSKPRNMFHLAAVGCAAMLVPFGLGSQEAALALAGISVLMAVAMISQKHKALIYLAAGEIVIGAIAYGGCSSSFSAERSLIGFLLILAVSFWGFGLHKSKYGNEALVGCGLLGWAVASQIANCNRVPFGIDAAMSGLWALWALLQLGTGFKLDVRGARVFGYFLLGATLVKVLLNDLSSVQGAIRAAILLVLGLAMLAGGYIAIRSNPRKAGKSAGSEESPFAEAGVVS